MMQAAGGIDWMVSVAAGIIEKRPKQITLIAPLTAFLFCVGSGTGNIIYPLLPVIYDVSYKNNIRPARPLTVTVVQSGIALAASPVSAAMAAMLTLTDVAPYNLGLSQILAITIPACVIGIFVTSLVVNRMWKDLDEDPEVQARIASGQLAPQQALEGESRGVEARPSPRRVATPHWPSWSVSSRSSSSACSRELRPAFASRARPVPIDMTTTIVLVMFVVGVAILYLGRPDVREVPDQSVFKAGMISAIALFGIAWLTATFIAAHEDYIIETIGGWVTSWQFIFALAVFLVAALTTSQSTATRTIVPIGLAVGLPAGVVTGMWAGGLGGVYTLPANGTQIAAANFDQTGTTKLGTKLIDHSFFIPMLVLSVTTVAVGALIGGLFF